jgi:hypothetical protein
MKGRPFLSGNLVIAPMQAVLVPFFLSQLCTTIANGSIAKELDSIKAQGGSAQGNFASNPTTTPGSGSHSSIQTPNPVLNPPTPASSLTLDGPLSPILLYSSGSFVITAGGISVSMPSEYDNNPPFIFENPNVHKNPQNSNPNPNPNPNSNPDIGSSKSSVISLTLGKGVHIITRWGELCSFEGLEIIAITKEISLNICQLSFIDPFDVCFQILVRPSLQFFG